VAKRGSEDASANCRDPEAVRENRSGRRKKVGKLTDAAVVVSGLKDLNRQEAVS